MGNIIIIISDSAFLILLNFSIFKYSDMENDGWRAFREFEPFLLITLIGHGRQAITARVIARLLIRENDLQKARDTKHSSSFIHFEYIIFELLQLNFIFIFRCY